MFLLACAPDAQQAGPTAWVYVEEDAPVVLLSPTQLEQAVDDVVSTLHRVDPMAVFRALEDAEALGDGACPEEFLHNGQPVLSGDCTATSGATFLGFALWNHLENQWLEIDGVRSFHTSYDWTTGLLRILGADGWTLEVLGDDMLRVFEGDDGERVTAAYVWGDLYAANSTWADSWLGDNLGVELYYRGEQWPDRTIGSWDVGISRMEGTARAARVVLATDAACPTEGTGTFEIEDAEGTWYTVRFDGDTVCDGCGEAESGGEPLGAVCSDMRFLVDWEVDPWE